ncbi:flap endonuclease GEN-like 1 isoform X2 [Benincasa hispida]|uniref:flap endonuclease GEN-like 1 isoform X2 n=1 Tax=Benincasa hispida TaxID=102211 RepID=UPI001901A363|nr:flap endonuclease GEN-like 1 isoform X2 [Benincasa hispida]
MGVGGHFWDLLKPHARTEGFDFLRNKRVAVDLSFWIVQHETAIKSSARSPHLRLTFFRTITLFAKFGAFPVFVVDGTPSPLKSKARIARFFRLSGIDTSDLPKVEDRISVDRNRKFAKCVKECVELLELFGVPVLEAKGEAEALCAELNRKGFVDACITADSDAFLFGAKCVIKSIHPNSKEPLECYFISDIEAALGLNRKHLIAISLLVGNDHNLNGVQGVGLDTAVRFVQDYTDDEILNKLYEIGNEDNSMLQGGLELVNDYGQSLKMSSRKIKCSHCSFCGHPGSKRAHVKFPCEYCDVSHGEGCIKKPDGFKCNCSSCDTDREEKEKKKQENWRLKVCKKIAMEPNFPSSELIQMYQCDNHSYFSDDDLVLSWGSPRTEMLVDFLVFHLRWEPSYIRQRMLPMLSTIFLREMANNPIQTLLYGQYEFDSILREKIRYGHPFYVVKWKKAVPTLSNVIYEGSSEGFGTGPDDAIDIDETVDLTDESDSPKIHIQDGCSFLLTDENIDLVGAAYPEQAANFLQEKEMKRQKTPTTPACGTSGKSDSSKGKGVQLSITEFYRATKTQQQTSETTDLTNEDEETSTGKRKASTSSTLSKSVRRRLLFD